MRLTTQFMQDILHLVVPRLPRDQQHLLDGVKCLYLLETNDPMELILLGHSPQGDSSHKAMEIRLFTDGLERARDNSDAPWQRIAAFTTIHECAHIVASLVTGDGGHEDPVWAQACQTMGIKEERYSMKGPDWDYNFNFSDQDLWAAIKALPSYPTML